MKYSILKTELERLEKHWVRKLPSLHPGPSAANGEVQFFSCEHVYEGAPDNLSLPGSLERLPIIACVGINYDQDPGPKPYPQPHLMHKTGHWVEDYSNPEMRCALNLALATYFSNRVAWYSNGYASSNSLLPQFHGFRGASFPFILVATNLSPFLTTMKWGSLSPSHRSALRGAWNENQHLCDLITTIGGVVDLWVIHGKDAVWPTFDTSTPHITDWIKTPNLSCLGIRSMSKFWQTRSHPTAAYTWPACPCVLNKTTVLDNPVPVDD